MQYPLDNMIVKTINNLNMSDIVLRTAAPNQAITGKKHVKGVLDVEVCKSSFF